MRRGGMCHFSLLSVTLYILDHVVDASRLLIHLFKQVIHRRWCNPPTIFFGQF